MRTVRITRCPIEVLRQSGPNFLLSAYDGFLPDAKDQVKSPTEGLGQPSVPLVPRTRWVDDADAQNRPIPYVPGPDSVHTPRGIRSGQPRNLLAHLLNSSDEFAGHVDVHLSGHTWNIRTDL